MREVESGMTGRDPSTEHRASGAIYTLKPKHRDMGTQNRAVGGRGSKLEYRRKLWELGGKLLGGSVPV